MKPVYALVDANNFYASCERVFRPDLKNRAIAVLSNNDGCIIARSQELKDMGISAGVPLYKVKDIIQQKSVAVFSSNYPLYGDFSARIMQVIAQFSPDYEVYSIDEAFVNLTQFQQTQNLPAYLNKMQQTITRWTGIPVTVGASYTKTLAKAATFLVKKKKVDTPTFFLENNIDQHLKQVPVEDVWGIGYRSAKKLYALGIYSAFDFKEASPKLIRKLLSVTGARTQDELNGVSCIETQAVASHHSILSSRSFGQPVSHVADLSEAISAYVALAAQKLRKRKLVCASVVVFLKSNKFRKPYYHGQHLVALSTPTNATHLINQAALVALKNIYRNGVKYAKAGVLLLDLSPESEIQLNLFDSQAVANHKLNTTIDSINDKLGRNTLKFASEGTQKTWQMKSEKKSPNYTTVWEDIPKVT